MEQDIRWKQRFVNYQKALFQLKDAVELCGTNPINIIKEGIIQRFEFTHELAWKVMKDFLIADGIQNIMGSKSATRYAFSNNLIEHGQEWMDMIESRNITVHTYNEEILEEEYTKIIHTYYPLLIDFHAKMKALL